MRQSPRWEVSEALVEQLQKAFDGVRRGVPALMFKVAYAKGSPEEGTFKLWLRDRYHAPSDDLNQPVDKAAAESFDRLMAKLLERIANRDDRPHWKDSSFFKRFARGNEVSLRPVLTPARDA